MKENSYLQGLFAGVKTLTVGLRTTMRELFTKKITEQYPENRKELVMFDRFRGSLVMPHDENNEHKCVACGLCMINCPNDTITVVSKMIETEDGKKKKVLDKYIYNQGICMYCEICTRVCPHDAITFDQSYETAVFDRAKLIKQLNQPGSKCKERKPVARPAVGKPAAPVAPKPEAPAASSTETAAANN